MIQSDLDVADSRQWLSISFHCPKKTGTGTLSTLPDERKQFL